VRTAELLAADDVGTGGRCHTCETHGQDERRTGECGVPSMSEVESAHDPPC
jgi:hypothetical protein